MHVQYVTPYFSKTFPSMTGMKFCLLFSQRNLEIKLIQNSPKSSDRNGNGLYL